MQKLPVDGFKWRSGKSNFNEKIIKSYDRDNDKGDRHSMLSTMLFYAEYLENNLNSDFPFLPETVKIKKCCKLVCNLFNKDKH